MFAKIYSWLKRKARETKHNIRKVKRTWVEDSYQRKIEARTLEYYLVSMSKLAVQFSNSKSGIGNFLSNTYATLRARFKIEVDFHMYLIFLTSFMSVFGFIFGFYLGQIGDTFK